MVEKYLLTETSNDLVVRVLDPQSFGPVLKKIIDGFVAESVLHLSKVDKMSTSSYSGLGS